MRIFQVYKVLADQVELIVHYTKPLSCGAWFRPRRTKQGFTSKKKRLGRQNKKLVVAQRELFEPLKCEKEQDEALGRRSDNKLVIAEGTVRLLQGCQVPAYSIYREALCAGVT